MKSSDSGMVDLAAAMAGALLLAGCAVTPMGPTVQVMPGPGKSFDAFQTDQLVCKNYAQQQVQGQAENANQRAVGGAVLGTVLGAGLGAAIGGATGNAGAGAAIGAASGAGGGALYGADASTQAQWSIQQQYDNAFAQCMYAKGEQAQGFPVPAVAYSPPPPPPQPIPDTQPVPDPLVASIQTELIRLGLLSGQPDGFIGPRTRGAISSYQQARGLPVDGKPTQALLNALRQS
jgi:uncharacterized protein YcfJ